MKALPLALILTLSLTSAALAETIVDGVVYPEITELGRPRSVPAQSQLGRYSRPQSPIYTARQVSPLPSPPVTGFRGATTAPADLAPALTVTSNGGQVVQPAGYANTLPDSHVVPVTSLQPVTNVQPLGVAPVNSSGVPWRPIVNVRSMPNNYVVGQGVVGQPKVYVPNQPLRNFIRYITP